MKNLNVSEKSQLIFNLTQDEFKKIMEESFLKVLTLTKEPPPSPTFYSRNEACKLLKISLPTLANYMKKGLIFYHKIGSRILLSQDDIELALKVFNRR